MSIFTGVSKKNFKSEFFVINCVGTLTTLGDEENVCENSFLRELRLVTESIWSFNRIQLTINPDS